MGLDRCRTDFQTLADFAVGPPTAQQLDHIQFARGEAVPRDFLGRRRGTPDQIEFKIIMNLFGDVHGLVWNLVAAPPGDAHSRYDLVVSPEEEVDHIDDAALISE